MAARASIPFFHVGVVGNQGCGGNALVFRLTENTFSDSFISNIFEEKNKRFDHEGKIYGLSFGSPSLMRDVVGLTRFGALTSSRPIDTFRRCCYLFLVCFDITNRSTFDALPKILKQIEKHCYLTPQKCILVGTKADLLDEREVPSEDAQAFADHYKMSYYETSAKTGEGCDKLAPLLITYGIERRKANGIPV